MDPFVLLSAGLHYDKPKNKKPTGTHPQSHSVAVPLPALPRSGDQPRTKKRKKGAADDAQQQQQQHEVDNADAAGGISLFAGAARQTAQQQQQQHEPLLPQVRTNDPFEEANVIRKALRIKVKGQDVPPPVKEWSDIARQPKAHDQQQQQEQQQEGDDTPQQQQPPAKKQKRTAAERHQQQHQQQQQPVLLSRQLLQHLSGNGWSTPTPIQRQAVPALLSGRELLAVAPTGSGKTLAFVLPMLAILIAAKRQGGEAWPAAPKALLLSPTHELAAQTVRVLKLLLPGSGLRCCLLNNAAADVVDFSKVDVLVANPLRLKLMVEEGRLDLSKVSYLVLDEADKLLAMGFTEQVDAVLAASSNPAIVRALFSATLPDKVETLARSVLRDPLHIVVGERNTTQHLVSQRLLFVGREAGKLLALRQMLRGGGVKPPVLVFVSKKARAQQLHKELMYDGFHVDSISGDQPNSVRAAAVDNFRAGKTWVLIATDLIGRGMDFAGINTVVNYDFPNSTADYIHRVGRTGRAGLAGEAVTFFTEADAPRLRSIAHLVKEAGSDVPDWMLHLARQRKARRQQPQASGQPAAGAPRASKQQQQQQLRGTSSSKQKGSAAATEPNGGVRRKAGSAAGKVQQRRNGVKVLNKHKGKHSAASSGGKH